MQRANLIPLCCPPLSPRLPCVAQPPAFLSTRRSNVVSQSAVCFSLFQVSITRRPRAGRTEERAGISRYAGRNAKKMRRKREPSSERLKLATVYFRGESEENPPRGLFALIKIRVTPVFAARRTAKLNVPRPRLAIVTSFYFLIAG